MLFVPPRSRAGHILRGVMWAAFVIAPLAMIAVAVDMLLDRHVAETIKKEAEVKAVAWAADFVEQVPAIGDIIESGNASSVQSNKIGDSIAIGDIFRFKLFSSEGRLAFVSDDERFRNEGGVALNEKARRVFETGAGNVSVNDGRQVTDRPDTYVEAYVPAIAEDGRRIGVMEVYVDVSAVHTVLDSSFSRLSFYLIVGTGFVLL